MPASEKRSSRNASNPDVALIGSTIAGKYRAVRLLGRGNFGAVYLVELTDGMVGQNLALKILPEEISHDPFYREQFISEIRIAMKLVNKYIVQIRDVGSTEDGRLYYTMDFCNGHTLTSILKREGTVAIRHALRLARKVLRALESAHELGIVHRDIKPANIMLVTVDGNRSVRVLDFGVAHELGGQSMERRAWLGTPSYMPPEQFSGENIGFHTDTYAVGVVLYETITGVRPYPGTGAEEMQRLFETFTPRPPEVFRPELSEFPGLSRLLMKAIALDPADRFTTARKFVEAIQRVLHGQGRESRAPSDEDTDRGIMQPPAARAATPPAPAPAPGATGRKPADRAATSRAPASTASDTTAPTRGQWQIPVLVGILLYATLFFNWIKRLFMGEGDRELYFNLVALSILFVVIYTLLVKINRPALRVIRRFLGSLGRTIREDIERARRKDGE